MRVRSPGDKSIDVGDRPDFGRQKSGWFDVIWIEGARASGLGRFYATVASLVHIDVNPFSPPPLVRRRETSQLSTELLMSKDDPDWLDRTLFPFTSRLLQVDGNKVHYIDEGSGPTLLLLHGNPTWSFLYRHLVRQLAPRFRCVALDYPGFGLSKAAPGYGYTPREHSRVLESFVDALDLSDISLMVQDWGGPIGLGFAGRRPERVRSLVVGNSFAWPATAGMKGFSHVVGNRVSRYLITRHNLLARWLIPAGTNRKLTEAELRAYLGPFPTAASRLPTWIFARQIRESAGYLSEVEAGLARLRDKPTLIVWGDADGAFRRADRDRFASLLPRRRIVDLPGAKHFIQENAPDQIASAILDWQSGQP